MRTILVSLGALLVAGIAHAADARPIDACADPKTQLDLNVCAAAKADQAQAELDAAVKALLAAHKDDAVYVKRLEASQRAWAAFRDAELESTFAVEPKENPRVRYGSVYPMCFSSTKEALTRQRTVEIKKRATIIEGDVCP